jgi:hypothetical protein
MSIATFSGEKVTKTYLPAGRRLRANTYRRASLIILVKGYQGS